MSDAKDDGVSRRAELFPDSLVWAIVSVFVVGLGCVIGLMAVMKNYGLNDGLVIAFSLLIFLLMLVVESVFIWLLLSRKKEVREAGRLNEQMTKELGAAQVRALPEPAASVTEQTTRAFEPVYSERRPE